MTWTIDLWVTVDVYGVCMNRCGEWNKESSCLSIREWIGREIETGKREGCDYEMQAIDISHGGLAVCPSECAVCHVARIERSCNRRGIAQTLRHLPSRQVDLARSSPAQLSIAL
jgi:hypothetical protein